MTFLKKNPFPSLNFLQVFATSKFHIHSVTKNTRVHYLVQTQCASHPRASVGTGGVKQFCTVTCLPSMSSRNIFNDTAQDTRNLVLYHPTSHIIIQGVIPKKKIYLMTRRSDGGPRGSHRHGPRCRRSVNHSTCSSILRVNAAL